MNHEKNAHIMTMAFSVICVAEDPDAALVDLAQEIKDAGGGVTEEELRKMISEVSELFSQADELAAEEVTLRWQKE